MPLGCIVCIGPFCCCVDGGGATDGTVAEEDVGGAAVAEVDVLLFPILLPLFDDDWKSLKPPGFCGELGAFRFEF